MGCLRVVVRAIGTLAGLLAIYCFKWAVYQWQMAGAAQQQGDHVGENIHSTSADESLQFGLAFGALAVVMWVGSFFLRRRSSRQGAVRQARCPNCEANLPESEVRDGWCESCGKRLPPTLRP